MASLVQETDSVEIIGDEIILWDFVRAVKLNIIKLVSGFNIIESLQNNSIVAEFEINDGIDLINYFPIVGEEWIDIKLKTPGAHKVCEYKFFVHRITHSKVNNIGSQRNYILHCSTEDYLKNSYTLYSKRYNKNYNQAVEEALKTDLGSTKELEVEPTEGIFDYVTNKLRPFQVINLICERAKSAKYKSDSFVFYEDNEKYRFLTLEKLIEDRKPKAEKFIYNFHTYHKNEEDNYEKANANNVISYSTPFQGSVFDNIKNGQFHNQVKTFDILTGDYFTTNEYFNIGGHKEFKPTDNIYDHNTDAFNNFVSQRNGEYRMVLKDSARPNADKVFAHNDKLHYKRPFYDKIFQYFLNIRIYGDTNLLVGDVIKLKIREINGKTKNIKDQERLYTENYLVTEIKNTFVLAGDGRFSHFMNLDLRKPHFFEKIEKILAEPKTVSGNSTALNED